MRRKIVGIFGLLFLFVFVILVAVPTSADSVKDAEDKKAALEEKKKQAQSRIKMLESEKGDIKKYIQKLDGELAYLNSEITRLDGEIEESENNLEITREELAYIKETEENLYQTMKKRIKYMYENGNSDYLELMLSASNMSDFLNRAEYVAKISEYDQNMLDRYQAAKKEVELKEAEIKGKIEELSLLTDELQVEESSVKQLVAEKNRELSSYDQKIDESESIVDDYTQQISDQEDLIEQLIEEEIRRAEEEARKAEEERLRKEEEERKRQEEEERKRQESQKNQSASQNNGNNNSNSNGSSNGNTSGSTTTPDSGGSTGSTTTSGYMWPLPNNRTITSYFGNRNSPTAGASSYHQGIDISAPNGTNILASASGTVSVATYQWAAGNYVMISHGNGVSTVYMHCSKLLVSQGQTVQKGDVIAQVGSTGVSTGNHLHFGVRKNGTYVDPLGYVSP